MQCSGERFWLVKTSLMELVRAASPWAFRRATEDLLLYYATQRFQEMNSKVFQYLTFHTEAITSKWKHVSLSQAKIVLCEAGEMKGLKKTGRQSSEFLKELQLRFRDNSRSGCT